MACGKCAEKQKARLAAKQAAAERNEAKRAAAAAEAEKNKG